MGFKRRYGRRPDPAAPDGHPSDICKAVVAVSDESLAVRLARGVCSLGDEWQAQTATDCYAAGEMVGLWHPDVLVLGTDLPGIEAHGLCRSLTSRKRRKLAVILLGAPGPEAVRRAAACGAAAYLPLPPEVSQLHGTLVAIRHGRAQVREARHAI